MFAKLYQHLKVNPRQVFLIDSLGALLSAFLLGVVLVQLESYIGMPRKVLYFLALIPCLFFCYSLYCYFRFPKKWRPFLKGIAGANLMYCLISLGFVFFYFGQLTYLGLFYFLNEIIIVMCIGITEFKIAK